MAEMGQEGRQHTQDLGVEGCTSTAAGENAQPELALVSMNVTLVCVLNT